MQTTVENTDKHTVKLTIKIEPEQVEKDLARTYAAIARQVKVPGFRKGKVPARIIDAQVGRDVVIEEFISDTVPAYYRQAMNEQDLAPITDPEVDLEPFEDGKPLVFTAVVEVRPRLELTEADYKGVKIKAPAAEATDEEVQSWIDRLRERFAELEPAERAIADGDFVELDLQLTDGGEPLEALARNDYLYYVSSEEFGPELDQQLKGKSAGETVEFESELPMRFGDELTGRPIKFSVTIKDVKARVLPEANDDFAKMASEFDTVEELRDDLRKRLGELKEREIRELIRERALTAVADAIEVDLPERLIEDEVEHRVSHAAERAQRAGMELSDMLETQGWDEERFRADSTDHAVRAIKSDLILEGISRAEELQVSAEELGAEIAALAQVYQRDVKELAKQLDRSGQIVSLASDIIRRKALDILADNAEVEIAEDEPEPQDGPEKSSEATDEPSDAPSGDTVEASDGSDA